MITKLRYVGTGEGGALTQNNEYVVLGFVGLSRQPSAIVIDDNGVPYATQMPIDDTSEWQLACVTECGDQIFPAP